MSLSLCACVGGSAHGNRRDRTVRVTCIALWFHECGGRYVDEHFLVTVFDKGTVSVFHPVPLHTRAVETEAREVGTIASLKLVCLAHSSQSRLFTFVRRHRAAATQITISSCARDSRP